MKFEYYAKNLSGQEIKGEAEAQNRFDLAKILRQRKYTLVSFKKKKQRGILSISIPGFGGVSMAEKIIFSQNLSVMISAGVPLVKGLEILGKQTQNLKFKDVIKNLSGNIRKGKSLSESMEQYPKIFSSLFIAMIRVGEESGNLSESLKIVGEQIERDNTLRKKIKGAMIYPLIIVIAMIIIAILMLIYVVPTLISTFQELGVDLPASTKAIIFISGFLTSHTLSFILSLFFVIVAGSFALQSETGKRAVSTIILKLPIFSPLVKKINSARTSRTLASLISSGVDILDALDITKDVLQNHHYKAVLEQAKKDIQKGLPLSESFKKANKLYPVLVGEMMSVGEETGQLSSMLTRLADFYEEDVSNTTNNMSTIIEPVLMVIIGAAVGFFAISMIKPMYSMMNGI